MQYEKAKYLGAKEVFLAHFMGSVIVEPKELREEMIKELEELLKEYKS
jgi:predicted DNA-binding transcriptional regulator YafY